MKIYNFWGYKLLGNSYELVGNSMSLITKERCKMLIIA